MEEPGESGSLHVPAGHAEAPGRQRRVFISYASHDTFLSQKVCSALEVAGFPCWIAPRNVVPGTLYAEGIVRALDESTIVVLILSEQAVASAHVGKELERATSKRHPIIALRTDTAPLTPAFEYFLNESQWIEAGAGRNDAAIAQLVEAVGQHLSPGSAAAPTHTPQAPVVGRKAATPRRFWVVAGVLVALALVASYFVADKAWLHRHSATATGPATIEDKSIAVLPFVDMSEKHDQEYFADGMAEDILDLLAKIPAIKVIGRTSSFQFKGQNQDLRAIGAKLGVAYVLEGSVRKSGDRVRVTAQLIDARDGAHVWSETYDQNVGDVLKMQDKIAVALVRTLQIAVGATGTFGRTAPINAAAYNLYLQGRYAFDRGNKESLEEAVSYYQQALDLDPTFVDTEIGLSAAYTAQADDGFVPVGVGYEQARAAANSVLKRDPTNGNAHLMLSLIHTLYDWDWVAADREQDIASKLMPHNPDVLANGSRLQMVQGHYANSVKLAKEQIARDPLNAMALIWLSSAQVRLGEVAEAQAAVRKSLDIHPDMVWNNYWLGMAMLLGGDREGALEAMQRDAPIARTAGLPVILWALGRTADSDAALKQLVAKEADCCAYEIAQAYAYRGERDDAFRWLERAYAQKDTGLYSIKGNPLLAQLEPDPRYKAFLKKMNLPE